MIEVYIAWKRRKQRKVLGSYAIVYSLLPSLRGRQGAVIRQLALSKKLNRPRPAKLRRPDNSTIGEALVIGHQSLYIFSFQISVLIFWGTPSSQPLHTKIPLIPASKSGLSMRNLTFFQTNWSRKKAEAYIFQRRIWGLPKGFGRRLAPHCGRFFHQITSALASEKIQDSPTHQRKGLAFVWVSSQQPNNKRNYF